MTLWWWVFDLSAAMFASIILSLFIFVFLKCVKMSFVLLCHYVTSSSKCKSIHAALQSASLSIFYLTHCNGESRCKIKVDSVSQITEDNELNHLQKAVSHQSDYDTWQFQISHDKSHPLNQKNTYFYYLFLIHWDLKTMQRRLIAVKIEWTSRGGHVYHVKHDIRRFRSPEHF